MTQSRRSFITKSAVTAAMGFSSISAFGSGLETAVERTPKSSIPSDLKITEIKCGYIRNGHSLFVKIHTNQGIWGCGEGVDATPGTYHLVKMFGERIKGKSPLNVHRLFEDIRRSGFFEGAQSGMFVSVLLPVKLLAFLYISC
jgi:galactonate dehydratase